MNTTLKASSLAGSLLILTGLPALATPTCSAGVYTADAVVQPSGDIGEIRGAKQFAWDGAGNVIEVCELLTDGGDFNVAWSLFSGEIDADFGGICVSLLAAEGTDWFSCATPEEVSAAYAAEIGSETSTLRFTEWAAGAP